MRCTIRCSRGLASDVVLTVVTAVSGQPSMRNPTLLRVHTPDALQIALEDRSSFTNHENRSQYSVIEFPHTLKRRFSEFLPLSSNFLNLSPQFIFVRLGKSGEVKLTAGQLLLELFVLRPKSSRE